MSTSLKRLQKAYDDIDRSFEEFRVRVFENKTKFIDAWRMGTFETIIEEAPEDIHLAIGYTDHGDDFVYIQTKDGKAYTYGYWCHRNFNPDYDKLKTATKDELDKSGYIRVPILFEEPIDGVLGIAAKKKAEEEIEDKILFFDEFNFVIKDGKELVRDEFAIVTSNESDEWGYEIEMLYLDQFEDDADSKILNECLELVQEHKRCLDEIEAALSEKDTKQLVHIRSQLEDLNTNIWIPDKKDV